MRKFLLLLVPILSLTFLYARWRPLEITPGLTAEGTCIAYGDRYIWCFSPLWTPTLQVYSIDEPVGWYYIDDHPPIETYIAAAIAFESGFDKRVFMAAEVPSGTDQLFVYTRNNLNTHEGYWNASPLYLPQECDWGVSLAYQPIIENGYQRGGWLYYLPSGGSRNFWRCFIADTAVGPRGRGNMSWEWELMDDVPVPVPVEMGASMCFVHHSRWGLGDSIFVLVGGERTDCYCFCPGQRKWEPSAPTEVEQTWATSVVGGKDEIHMRIWAIFNRHDRHWKLKVRDPDVWWPCDELPRPIEYGCTITCDPGNGWLYLVTHYWPDPPNFWYNSSPEEDEIGGSQSREVFPIAQRVRVINHSDRLEVQYSTDVMTKVKIQVYNLLGKQIKTLLSGKVEKGEHQVLWDMKDNSNRKIASGIYIITVEKENKAEHVKVTIR